MSFTVTVGIRQKLFSVIAQVILHGEMRRENTVCTLPRGLVISFHPGQTIGIGRVGVVPSNEEIKAFLAALAQAEYVIDESTCDNVVGWDGQGREWRSVVWSAPIHKTRVIYEQARLGGVA